MATKNGWSCCWQSGLSFLTLVGTFFYSNWAIAQVIPDRTLDAESSRVNTIDELNERIDGGARRGGNLFHSFEEFNVGEGRGVFFVNPEGVANILSRVTGSNPSQILGRLGVLGEANLFLLNPNGILFGPNASLAIEGSFVATTASGINLGSQGFFSATRPEQSNLLSVNPGALFFNQAANQPGNIINTGNLATGQNLTLSAGNLELQGQLLAGNDLTLQALNTVQIRDSVANPFVAASNGQMLLQGERSVDISALSHPQSGFFSGNDLRLRSNSAVSGDARYWSSGDVRIERLDSSLGDWFSFNGSVLRAIGDVSFNNYAGVSLQILAGGSVTVPGIILVGSPATLDLASEEIALSDGTRVAIDGNTQPTLDVRAGVDPDEIGIPSTADAASSADISIFGIITAGESAANGLVLLTNQYSPNPSLPGDIEVGAINTDDVNGVFSGDSGSVILESRGGVTVDSYINSSSSSGDAGDISLIANGAILINDNALLNSSTGGTGRAGDLRVLAETLSLTNGAFVNVGTAGSGRGGNITIQASDSVRLTNGARLESNSAIRDREGNLNPNVGSAGNITIETSQLILQNAAFISTSTFGEANAGSLRIEATDSVSLEGGSSLGAISIGTGSGGNLSIETRNLTAANNSGIANFSIGQGNAGRLTLRATDQVNLRDGSFLITSSFGVGAGGELNVETGSLSLQARSGIVTSTYDPDTFDPEDFGIFDPNFAAAVINQVNQAAEGDFEQGNSGNLTIQARDSVNVANGSSLATSGTGRAAGGDLALEAARLTIEQAAVSTATFGTGDAGNLSVETTDSVRLANGARLESTSAIRDSAGNFVLNAGSAGNISIETGQLILQNAAFISTSTLGEKNAGSLVIEATDSINLAAGSNLATVSLGTGAGGDLAIATSDLTVANSGIATLTVGQGNAGRLTIDAIDQVRLREGGFLTTSSLGVGGGGELSIETGSLNLQAGGSILTSTFGPDTFDPEDFGISDPNVAAVVIDVVNQAAEADFEQGSSGNLTVRARESVNVVNGSLLTTSATGRAAGGDLTIEAPSLTIDRAIVTTATLGTGDAGNLSVEAADSVRLLNGARLESNSSIRDLAGNFIVSEDPSIANAGSAGNITIETGQLILEDVAFISTATFGEKNAGSLTIEATDSVSLAAGSNLATTSLGTGSGGDLAIETRNLTATDDSGIGTLTIGQGNAGRLTLRANDQITLRDESFLTTSSFGVGRGGELIIETGRLNLQRGSGLLTSTFDPDTFDPEDFGISDPNVAAAVIDQVNQAAGGDFEQGSSGNLTVRARESVNMVNDSFLVTAATGRAAGGDLTIEAPRLTIDRATVTTATFGTGDAGNLSVESADSIVVSGSGSRNTSQSNPQAANETIDDGQSEPSIFDPDFPGLTGFASGLSTQTEGDGRAGALRIQTSSLVLNEGAQISARSQGQENAGSITIAADERLEATNGDITTSAERASGGAIRITAGEIRLQGDSDIRTDVASGAGGGGNIILTADSILAFGDSDVLAFAQDGRGGDITLNTPVFFGSRFDPVAEETEPESLDNNARVDVNASGAVAGAIAIPDISFIQNSLTELPETVIDTDTLVANSCVVPNAKQKGTFILTGAGGLPERPGDSVSLYPTGTVRPVADNRRDAQANAPRLWQVGDSIVEPQGVYQLNNGKLVMSRQCSRRSFVFFE